MKPVARPLVAATVLAVVGLLASCAPPPPPEPPKPLQTPEQMIESAKAVDAAFLAAFNKADAEAVVATYWNSPDTVLYLPDAMEARGFDAIKASFAQSLPAMGGCQLATNDVNYRAIGEDSVVSSGLWTMTCPAAEGAAPEEMKGRVTALLQRKDGRWLYVVDHASVPTPPPAGDAAGTAAPAAAEAVK